MEYQSIVPIISLMEGLPCSILVSFGVGSALLAKS